MIELVGHPFLLCCIGLDVDDIPNSIGNQECREFDLAMLCHKALFSHYQKALRECERTFESPLEHMARARPITEGMRHIEYDFPSSLQ